MVEITVQCQEIESPPWISRVEPFIRRVLDKAGLAEGAMSLVFCGDAFMIPLNEGYRGKKGSTDVLSFTDEAALEAAEEPAVYGDIILSLDQLQENSREFGVSREEEMKRLIIHGILHLAGEDHASLEETEPMLLHQERLLEEIAGYTVTERHETDC